MSAINTLDGLRYHELGPILDHINSEVEIKNLYRIMRVIQPLIASLDARGGLDLLTLNSVGTGTSLIFDNTLPDFFLRSIVAGVAIAITTSADGKEITIAASGAGTHELSDGATHTDVGEGARAVNDNEEDGVFLSFDKTTHGQWELCRNINQDPVDTDSSGPYPHRVGCFKEATIDDETFNSAAAIGGSQKFRMISAVSGSFLKLTKAPTTEDIQIAIDTTLFGLTNLNGVTITSPLNGALLTFIDGSGWIDQTSTMRFTRVDGTTAGPEHNFRSARGSVGAETGAESGDELGEISFRGHDNSGAGLGDSKFDVGARIRATALEDFSTTAHGSKLEFSTVDIGTGTLDVRMTINHNGEVTVAQTFIATILQSGVADGTAPMNITSTTMVDNLTSEFLAADPSGAKTKRGWDTVEYTRQVTLEGIRLVGGSATWLNGITGPSLTPVIDATPQSQYIEYSARIPGTWKSATTVTLKWRFYNVSVQSGTNNVQWRIKYNSAGSSGTIAGLDLGTVTTTLANDQAASTIVEESIALSNVVANDLLNVSIGIDSGGTDAGGDFVIIDRAWIEIVQAGVPDTGSAS